MTSASVKNLRLYHYWRSSSSWRVRWGFYLKGISFEPVAISLLDGTSEAPEHRARNPLGFVPVLEFLNESNPARRFLTESLAILEWAEEQVPSPSLFPQDPYLRARTRALAELINSGTHPLQNLPVQDQHSDDPAERKRWAQHWIHNGLQAYETLVAETAATFSVGDTLTLADLCLAPQCYNAARYEIDVAQFPVVNRILSELKKLPSYQASEPDRHAP